MEDGDGAGCVDADDDRVSHDNEFLMATLTLTAATLSEFLETLTALRLETVTGVTQTKQSLETLLEWQH